MQSCFFHDINNNGKFDMFLGIPKEQYGFSNNATPSVAGPPSFEKAKFFLNSGQKLTITLQAR